MYRRSSTEKDNKWIEYCGDGKWANATDSTSPYYLTLAEHSRYTGGSIVKRQQYFLTLGHHTQDGSWTYEKPALYRMEGGALNGSNLLIGYTAQDSSADGNRFVQTGGTANSRCLVFGGDKRFCNEPLAKMKDAYVFSMMRAFQTRITLLK